MENFEVKNYYEILEIEQNASDEQIRKAYFKLAVKYHPDKNLDNKEAAHKKFIEIAEAYETLKDPEKRAVYDESLKCHDRVSKDDMPEEEYKGAERANPRRSGHRQYTEEERMRHAREMFKEFNDLLDKWNKEQERKRELGLQLVEQAKVGKWEDVYSLILQGANLDERCKSDKYGNTALHFAIDQGNYEAIEMMCIKKSQGWFGQSTLDTSDRVCGYAPLHESVAFAENIRVLKTLIFYGAKTYTRDRSRNTPLHLAIIKDKLEYAEFLATKNMDSGIFRSDYKYNMSHNLQDENGNTPLHLALQKGMYRLADILVQNGADVDIKNKQGFCAYDYNLPHKSSRLLKVRFAKAREQAKINEEQGSCSIM